MIDGVRPVFFVGKGEINYTEFFSGTENVAIELGANQCMCTWSYLRLTLKVFCYQVFWLEMMRQKRS